MHPLFGEYGIISSTRFLSPSVVDLGLSIRGLTGLGTSSLLRNSSRLVRGVQSVSVIALFIITSVEFVVVMVVVFS